MSDTSRPEAHAVIDTVEWLAWSVEQTLLDWWRAKSEGAPFRGSKYARNLIEDLRKLHDTVMHARRLVSTPAEKEGHERLSNALRRFRDQLGVSHDELKWADNAIGHPEGVLAGGLASEPFGGVVTATTASVSSTAVRLGSRRAVHIHDLTVALVGPKLRVSVSAQAARIAARRLASEAIAVLRALAGDA